MKRTMAACVACAALLLAFAGTASAKPDNGNGGSSAAAKLCAAQKKADHAAFKATYGDPRHAMRNCMRANRGTATPPAEGAEEFENAAETCRAERTADPAAFTATYGTNHNGRNAFGKCVSQHANGTYEEGTPVA